MPFPVLRCRKYVLISMLALPGLFAHAQTPPAKEINHQLQTWFSINSTFHLDQHWGIMADFHVRRNNFLQDPSFYFLRVGPNYWIKDNMSASIGYAHLWNAPPQEGYETWSNENRIYQQFLFSSKIGRTSMLQRFRNEQRWQEKVLQDVKTGEIRFTNRVRYLLSFTFPMSSNPKRPSLVLADEILLHFGKDVVYNILDQNRIFIGIRQGINAGLSYDFGYMNVFQQKYSGYQYDMNHTIRLFFYYSGGSKKPGKAHAPEHHDE